MKVKKGGGAPVPAPVRRGLLAPPPSPPQVKMAGISPVLILKSRPFAPRRYAAFFSCTGGFLIVTSSDFEFLPRTSTLYVPGAGNL